MRLMLSILMLCVFSPEANSKPAKTEYQTSKEAADRCKRGYSDFLQRNRAKVVNKLVAEYKKRGFEPAVALKNAEDHKQSQWTDTYQEAVDKITTFCKSSNWHLNCVVKIRESPDTGVLCSVWRIDPKTRKYTSTSSPDKRFPHHPY